MRPAAFSCPVSVLNTANLREEMVVFPLCHGWAFSVPLGNRTRPWLPGPRVPGMKAGEAARGADRREGRSCCQRVA